MNLSYWEEKYFLGKADFVVVGLGLTGLQTAILLKEKHPKANVIGFDRFGWSLGASTRNAGFACFANVSEILDDLQHDSQENVYQLITKRYLGLNKLINKFSSKSIGYEPLGSSEVFTQRNKSELYNCIDSLQAINTILYSELGLDNVFEYTSKSFLVNGVGMIKNKFEGQLNTGKLYHTIYERAIDLGVKLLGGNQVVSWERSDTIQLKMSSGMELDTSNLIFCTNAFNSALIDEEIKPVRGQVLVTEQLNKPPKKGSFFYDKGYYYWRDIDNRILIGGARNADFKGEESDKFEANETVERELKRFLYEEIFDKEVKIESKWSGIMGMGTSKEKTPIVKEVEPGVFMAARLGGMGVALSSMIAEDLVNLMK